MYSWLWRHLPGGLPGKLASALVLIAATVVVLFLVVFPWISPKLPGNQVTVDHPAPPHTSTPAPHH